MFSGAGGLDLGFERAGWSRLLANDIDRDSAATLRENTSKALRDTVVEADIRSFTAADIRARAGGFELGSLTAIVGGPPCQSWSSAGHQLGMKDDRGQLFLDFVRLANRLDPRFIVMENVRGLLTARGPNGEPGSALAMIREDLRQQGWQTTVSLLNAADYGIPQRRVRLFVVAYREGDRPPFPAPSHAKKPGPLTKPWVSLSAALSKVRNLSDDEVIRPSKKLADELAHITPGTGVKSPGKPETTRPGGHWGYKQGAFVADLAQPARTVTASTAQDWVIDPERGLRRLSPRECAAIQTFPADWKWVGGRASVYRQIGNAVPPKLAEVLARSIDQQIACPRQAGVLNNVVELEPLAPNLAAAIAYTVRDNIRNAASRQAAPIKRRVKVG